MELTSACTNGENDNLPYVDRSPVAPRERVGAPGQYASSSMEWWRAQSCVGSMQVTTAAPLCVHVVSGGQCVIVLFLTFQVLHSPYPLFVMSCSLSLAGHGIIVPPRTENSTVTYIFNIMFLWLRQQKGRRECDQLDQDLQHKKKKPHCVVANLGRRLGLFRKFLRSGHDCQGKKSMWPQVDVLLPKL